MDKLMRLSSLAKALGFHIDVCDSPRGHWVLRSVDPATDVSPPFPSLGHLALHLSHVAQRPQPSRPKRSLRLVRILPRW